MNLRRSLGLATGLALVLVADAGVAGAHTVGIDGSATEWFAVPAPIANLGRLARRPGGAGEYVWRDAVGDQRAAWPGRPHDLLEVRVTGDRDFLYLMAKLAGPVATSGDSVPQLQVAIDTNRLLGSGGTAFADSACFEMAGMAAYERLVVTRFGSGGQPRLLDGWGNDVAAATAASLSPDGTIEMAVPWSALGFQFVPTAPIRVAAALFLTDAGDTALDPLDGTPARAADVMTQNGSPGANGSTAVELADGWLDYSADLWFDAGGEVVSPVLVNEAYFEAGVNSQWLEIVNPTQAVVSVTEFKIGDQETPDGHEAIAQFPAGTLLLPGQVFVVARDGATFLADNAFHADAECNGSDPGSPDMLMFPAWATGTGFNIPNSGDEILLLDGSNTVVDVVTFKNRSWPGITPAPGVLAQHSLERINPATDTDDCAADFGDQPVPNPGLVVVVAGVGDSPAGGALAWSPPTPNPSRGRVALSLRLEAAGDVTVNLFDASGRLVRELYRGGAGAGALALSWDGSDANGRNVAPGVYFVRAATREGARSLRLTVVR